MNAALAVLLLVQATPPAGIPAPEPAFPASSFEEPSSRTTTGQRAFGKLFIEVERDARTGMVVSELAEATQRPRVVPRGPPKVVCGMRVFHADGTIDPKFVKTVPGDAASMKIRRFVAPACSE